MAKWRYFLISAYVVFGLVGAWLAIFYQSSMGLVLFGIGFLCVSVHMAIERVERKREEASQAAWIVEVNEVADCVQLDGYGIKSLKELARYHDLEGRNAILTTLRALPTGEKFLLDAARKVEPDAIWD